MEDWSTLRLFSPMYCPLCTHLSFGYKKKKKSKSKWSRVGKQGRINQIGFSRLQLLSTINGRGLTEIFFKFLFRSDDVILHLQLAILFKNNVDTFRKLVGYLATNFC